jgi:hypothetical protein
MWRNAAVPGALWLKHIGYIDRLHTPVQIPSQETVIELYKLALIILSTINTNVYPQLFYRDGYVIQYFIPRIPSPRILFC